jgi:hypothetical protein
VFIDGRADPYGDDLIRAYQQAISAREGWQDVLSTHQVRTVLIASDSALASVMCERPEWHQVYRDDQATVFVQEKSP